MGCSESTVPPLLSPSAGGKWLRQAEGAWRPPACTRQVPSRRNGVPAPLPHPGLDGLVRDAAVDGTTPMLGPVGAWRVPRPRDRTQGGQVRSQHSGGQVQPRESPPPAQTSCKGIVLPPGTRERGTPGGGRKCGPIRSLFMGLLLRAALRALFKGSLRAVAKIPHPLTKRRALQLSKEVQEGCLGTGKANVIPPAFLGNS